MTANAAFVLVVDDEPDLRTLYELTLLREGHRVETAASVQEARQKLRAQHFDAVLTDMRLPDGQGLELIKELRNAIITADAEVSDLVAELNNREKAA